MSNGITRENLLWTLPYALQQDKDKLALAQVIADELTALYRDNRLLALYTRIDELDEALTCAEDLCSFDISFYNDRKNAGDNKERLEVLKNEVIRFFPSLYNFNFSTPDNILANHERYKKCEEMLKALE